MNLLFVRTEDSQAKSYHPLPLHNDESRYTLHSMPCTVS